MQVICNSIDECPNDVCEHRVAHNAASSSCTECPGEDDDAPNSNALCVKYSLYSLEGGDIHVLYSTQESGNREVNV